MSQINLVGGVLKREIIQQAYAELGQASYEWELTAEEQDLALRRLDSMMAEWAAAYGLQLGYYSPAMGGGSVEDESGLQQGVIPAVVAQLALRIAPTIGKSVAPEVRATAAQSFAALRSGFGGAPQVYSPPTVSGGWGARSRGGYASRRGDCEPCHTGGGSGGDGIVSPGDPGLPVFSPSPSNAGKFLALDANGVLTYVDKPTLDMSTLAASDGSNLIGYRGRTVNAKLSDASSSTDYGAQQSTLPTTFNNTPAIQASLDANAAYAGNLGGTVHLPKGLWALAGSLTVGDYSEFTGDGPRASILYNEQAPLNVPAFVNGATQSGFWRVSNIGLRGYSAGFQVTGTTDGMRFSHINMLGVQYGFVFDNMLQTTIFEDIEFFNGVVGILSNSAVANRVTVRDCDFKVMSDSSIRLAGAEDFHIENCRFEGGGLAGRSTLDFAGVRVVKITAGYFESTHENLLRLVNSVGGLVVFDGCHFTGTGATFSDLGYRFLTDGTGTIVFKNCHATYPMRIPPNSVVEGVCSGLYRCEFTGKMNRLSYRPPATTWPVASFERPSGVNDPTNQNSLSGVLNVSVAFASADGGVAGTAARRVPFSISTSGGANCAVMLGAETAMNTGAGVNLTFAAVSATPTSVTLQANIANVGLNQVAVIQVSTEVEWNQVATLGDGRTNTFAVSLG